MTFLAFIRPGRGGVLRRCGISLNKHHILLEGFENLYSFVRSFTDLHKTPSIKIWLHNSPRVIDGLNDLNVIRPSHPFSLFVNLNVQKSMSVLKFLTLINELFCNRRWACEFQVVCIINCILYYGLCQMYRKPCVIFINIFFEPFSYESVLHSLLYLHFGFVIVLKNNFIAQAAAGRKMLMKFTPLYPFRILDNIFRKHHLSS